MGASNYDRDAYIHRSTARASTGTPTFKHHDDIRTKKVAAKVHDSLNPHGIKLRESRDSNEHKITVPIALCNDLTGSMQTVPAVLQAKEPELMGMFLKDRAAGKNYLGGGYPAILISGVDDYFALKSHPSGPGSVPLNPSFTLQIGQFESGLEIDDNLTNLVLTGQGGGNQGESYDMFLYALARHTAHDHWDKRKRRGHAFILGDEPIFDFVDKEAVYAVFGEKIEQNIPIAQIIAEVKERYNLFYIIPNQTMHYDNPGLRAGLKKLLGEENVLLLDDPTKICELLVSTVAMCEGTVSLEDLAADNVATGAVHRALVPLSRTSPGLTRHSAEDLPAVGARGKAERV